MNPSVFIPIILLWVIIFVMIRNRKTAIARRVIQKRKLEDDSQMKELAKRFLDKECLISSFDGNHQYEGVMKQVSDSAILLEKDGALEAINLDFVARIREYPKNKKGRKKSIVLD